MERIDRICLSSHPLMDTCFHILAVVNSVAMSILHKWRFQHVFSAPLVYIQGWSHWVIW